MAQTSSDPSPSNARRSKSKSKKPRKRVNTSSTPSTSKEPNVSSDDPSSWSSKPPQCSSIKKVSSLARNHPVKTNRVWIKKDSSKPSLPSSKPELELSTFGLTQFAALSDGTIEAKTSCSYTDESSRKPSSPSVEEPPPSPPSSLPSDISSPPLSPKHRPKLRRVKLPSFSNGKKQNEKANYMVSDDNSLPLYKIPKHIRIAIKRGVVPGVLNRHLSSSSYSDYFTALLCAEELYLQKWSKFQMLDMELEFHDATIHTWWKRRKKDKIFVVFDMDSIQERRPFLLSRDIVYARPSGMEVQPFEGIVYRVVASTHVLVDFEDDFHFQHRPGRRYDINFSFNRICFRRAHQAIQATSDPSFPKLTYLFPDCLMGMSLLSKQDAPPKRNALDLDQLSAIKDILSIKCPPPYLLEGQLCVNLSRNKEKKLSRTGEVVQEAVSRIYQSSPEHQILICSPLNSTCDALMINLKRVIPESEMFRANAAFREVKMVPTDILPSCPYDEFKECFTCPSIQELREFRVILSTFVSCFRLHRVGLAAGHFSHIFVADASAGTEPEAMIALANFANKDTVVVITGSPTSSPYLVRSDMAKRKGLKISFYERLWKEFSSFGDDHEET